MRLKATFLAGLAVGFVVGARAGRERYEQMVKASRKVAENPTVQKAAKTAGAKATELTKVAKDKAAERVPKLTEAAPARCAARSTGCPAGMPPRASPPP
jgi:glutamate-1-semialdehyde aminotransferase